MCNESLDVVGKHERSVRKRTAHIRNGGAHDKPRVMKSDYRFSLGDKVAIDPG